MKKTLIAVALATLSATSMADVILYGQIKGGVEVSKTKHIPGTVTQIVDYGSRIGFKGHEHLSGDLKAIWQLEQSVNIGGGVGTRFGSRDSFIGLEGGFGRLTVGYQHNFVGSYGDAVDIWAYSNRAAGLGVMTRGNDVVTRRTSVRYMSPDFGGFSFGAYVSPSDNNTAAIREDGTTVTAHTKDSTVYGAALRYKANGLFADVLGAYVKNGARNTTVATGDEKAGYQAIAQFGYDAAPWFAGVAYQYARNVDGEILNSGAAITRAQEVALSAAYDINNTVRIKGTAAYGFGFKTGVDGDEKAWGNGKYVQGLVGADLLLSKRTTVNGQFGYLQAGKNTDTTEKYRTGVVSVGMKHRF